MITGSRKFTSEFPFAYTILLLFQIFKFLRYDVNMSVSTTSRDLTPDLIAIIIQ
jgi:hypothetical protein